MPEQQIDDWRLNDKWQDEAAAKARKLLPNQGLHKTGEFIARLHPLAIDYLEQAPVISTALNFKRSSKADRLYIASRIGGPLERGEPLKKIMQALFIAYPLRRLSAYSLSPNKAKFIRLLSEQNLSSLSQAIPEKPKAQRTWLRAVASFHNRHSYGSIRSECPLEWAMTAISRSGVDYHSAGNVADYIRQNDTPDLRRWSWERAELEMNLWHDRLATERALPPGFRPDTQIDFSDWPDHYELNGYEFFKLNTPSMIMADGRSMRHCVASYMPNVINGQCSLYSVRKDMKRVATAEIADGHCVQLSGFANKRVSKETESAVANFTRLNPTKGPTP